MNHGKARPGVSFRQLTLNKYQATFEMVDKHTPSLIAWELKERPEHKARLKFVETNRDTATGDVTMEMHTTALCDVADLICVGARQASSGFEELEQAFVNAFEEEV